MTRTVSARTEFAPATSPCAACPWRTANQGRRHPDGWYTKANLRRLWAGLRRGERMTCHPTDPDNPTPPGVAGPAEGHPTRECAGALVLVQREAQRLGELVEAGGNLADYRRDHPRGLTRVGMAQVFANLQWGGVMPGTLEMAKVDLNTPGISAPGVVDWEPR